MFDASKVAPPPPRRDMDASQRQRRFSFPPLARVLPSSFHLRPHTSWVCPTYVLTA
jgi:hypothetical protein